MEEFIIKGGANFLKITFKKVFGFPKTTFHFGGYDTKSILEIESDSFKVLATLWVATGEIFEFYQKLAAANKVLTGSVRFTSYEGNLDFQITYDINGHALITGLFSKQNELNNVLKFEFNSDQTYVQETLHQLRMITEKYGDAKGIK